MSLFNLFCRRDPDPDHLHEMLHRIERTLNKMAVTEATFDQDLANLVTSLTTYIAAVNAEIALLQGAVPPETDFSAEDATVASASEQLSTALAALNPTATASPGAVGGSPVSQAKAALAK